MTRKEAERFLKIYNKKRYIILFPFYYSDDYSGIVLVDVVKINNDIIGFLTIPEDEEFGDTIGLEELDVEDLWIVKKVNFSRIKKV